MQRRATTVLLTLLLLGLTMAIGVSARANGQPNSLHARCDILAEIQLYGSKVYAGRLTASDFGNSPTADLPKNLGFPRGTLGLTMWIEDTRKLLLTRSDGFWTPAKFATVKKLGPDANDFDFASPNGLVGFDYGNSRRLSKRTTEWVLDHLWSSPKSPSQAIAWDRTRC